MSIVYQEVGFSKSDIAIILRDWAGLSRLSRPCWGPMAVRSGVVRRCCWQALWPKLTFVLCSGTDSKVEWLFAVAVLLMFGGGNMLWFVALISLLLTEIYRTICASGSIGTLPNTLRFLQVSWWMAKRGLGAVLHHHRGDGWTLFIPVMVMRVRYLPWILGIKIKTRAKLWRSSSTSKADQPRYGCRRAICCFNTPDCFFNRPIYREAAMGIGMKNSLRSDTPDMPIPKDNIAVMKVMKGI